jgi:hypothetical protein
MSGGGGSSNTTTQVQQIPAYEQQSSMDNQALAQSLASQPYPQYGGALIQPQNATQAQGQQQAIQAATGYQPQFNQAQNTTSAALNPTWFNNLVNASQNQTNAGLNASTVQGAQKSQAGAAQQAQALTNPNAVGSYMNPFVQQALAPQISALNLQLAGQQNQINSQASQAGAFGDARQGAAQGLQNFYGNQAFNQLVGTGYNNAYTQALSALGQAQGTQLGAASQYGNIAQTGLGEQGVQLQGAQQYGQLAGLANEQQKTQLAGGAQQAALANQLQQQELTGANATYNAGTQQQTQLQNQLNAAYQQYLNQVNWPYQMLNVRESALSNSPYNIATSVTLPSANSTAQGFGTLAGAAGLLGGLSSGAGNAPFGGQAMGAH